MYYIMLLLFIVDILVNFAQPIIQSWFSKDQTDTIVLMYVGIFVIKKILNKTYRKYVYLMGDQKALEFQEKALIRYGNLCQSDRESEDIEVFKTALNGMKNVVMLENAWFKISYNTFISMIISTFVTIWTAKSLVPIQVIVICYIGAIYFIMNQIRTMNDYRKIGKQIVKTNSQRNRLDYVKLRLGNHTCIGDIIKRTHKIELSNKQRDVNWQNMSNMISSPIIAAMFICLLSQPIDVRLDLSMFFFTLYHNMANIIGFIGSYERVKIQREKYDDYWKNKRSDPLPHQKSLPDTLTISEYKYNDLDTSEPMCFNTTASISSGQIIRLTGSTGSGKTTFVNAIKGVSKGMVIQDNDNPMCYLEKIAHMRQDIRGSIPFGEVSIQDLFNYKSDALVEEVLHSVGLQKWLVDVMENNLSKRIDNKISGGQKTLFCLALTLIDAIDKDMLILDEPEQGLDLELVPQTFQNMFEWLNKYNPKLRVIFVSHLCECVIDRLPEHSHWHIHRDTNNFDLVIS